MDTYNACFVPKFYTRYTLGQTNDCDYKADTDYQINNEILRTSTYSNREPLEEG